MRWSKRPAELLTLLLFNLILVASSSAGMIKEDMPSKSQLINDPSWTILVVTVDKANIANPTSPMAGFFVDEVLRGKMKNNYVNLVWRLPEIKPRGLQTGDKLIVFVLPNRDKRQPDIDAEVTEVYRFSDVNRKTVIENMAPPERMASIQLPLLLIIILIPIALLIFGKGHEKISLSLIILQFVVYFIYETGISKYSNIRIDLLLIYPALIASVGIKLKQNKRQPTE